MLIIDINGKERTIKDAPIVVTHVRKNLAVANKLENVDGELVTVENSHEIEEEEIK